MKRPYEKRRMKRAKLSIEKIVLHRDVDENPDISYIGEYCVHPRGEQCIDRQAIRKIDDKGRYVDHRLLDELFQMAKEGSYSAVREVGKLAGEIDYDIIDDTIPMKISNIDDDLLAMLHSAVEDGRIILGETRNDCDRGECRYFAPGTVDDSLPIETQRLYARRDYERAESLNRGNWSYICIRAVAYVAVNDVSQVIRSRGLYGIESDSDEKYIRSIEDEELADLTEQLVTLGFSRRSIAIADVCRELS